MEYSVIKFNSILKYFSLVWNHKSSYFHMAKWNGLFHLLGLFPVNPAIGPVNPADHWVLEKSSLSSKVSSLLYRKVGSPKSITQRPHWVWNFKCSQSGFVSGGWKWSLAFRQIVTFLAFLFFSLFFTFNMTVIAQRN